MKTRILVVTCALGIAACGGADTRPANDPASTNTTAAPTPSPETSSLTPGAASTFSANAVDAPPQATTGVPTQGATGRGDPTAGPTTIPGPAANTAASDPGVARPAPGTTVAPNPGVADQTKDATNTKINDRDRHGALTPMDQGGSAAERNITASIRKGVVSDKSLSFTAKNVKIITTGTKVTLRGPVKSDQERTAIETLAKQTSGVTEVDNQLEVKK